MPYTQITPNLVQLTRLGMMNAFLVREDDGWTVVDTSIGGTEKQIFSAIGALGGGDIKRIALTHAHSDHVGALDALAVALPDAEILAGERESLIMAGDKSLLPDEPQTRIKGGYPKVNTKPTRLLNEGDRVGSLEVIFTPGHTPGHISFFDTRDGTLLAGDAYTVLGGISTAGTMKPLFPLPAWATWHKPTGLASAKKLIALQPKRLTVGHGKTLENPVEAMQKAIDEAMRRLGVA